MTAPIYWTMARADAAEGREACLSPREAQKFSNLAFPKRRQEWLMGRWTAKQLVRRLPAYSRFELPDIEIHNRPDGAPYLLHTSGIRLPESLTISHSGGAALCALAPGEDWHLGADLELIEPRSTAFVEDYFTPAEQALVASSPSGQRDTLVNLIWSLKESMLKALGVGLHWDTRNVQVIQTEGPSPALETSFGWRSARLADLQSPDRPWTGWWQVRHEYVITLACYATGSPLAGSPELVEKIL